MMIKKILKALWRTCVVFAGLGALIVCCEFGYKMWKWNNYHYTMSELTESVEVHYFPCDDEYRLYNAKTDRYTLKGLSWVSCCAENDSLFVFCKDGKRGFANANTGMEVIPAQYDRAWVFSEGLAAVMKDGKIGFINVRNEVVLPFQYDYADRDGLAIDYLFRDGYCTMTDKRGACGLIDHSGKWVVDPKYDCIWTPHEKKYRIVKDNDQYGLLGDSLQFLFPIKYDYIEFAPHGVYLSKDGYKWQSDYDGTVIYPFLTDNLCRMEYHSGYTDEGEIQMQLSGYFQYDIYNHYGVIRCSDNKVIIPAIYEEVNLLSPDLFEVRLPDSDQWMLLDGEGKEVVL